jgi:uncharacterized protein YdeI (YjbR/CyaY-like superfamily)
MNPKVDLHISQLKKWQIEMEHLRQIMLDAKLTETIKWSKPCYMHDDANIAILYTLKDSCAIGFMKGALLTDPKHILLKPGENSNHGRWIKCTTVQEIKKLQPIIKAYIKEAIAIEKAGLKIEKNTAPLIYPEELKIIFATNKELHKAFLALTPGRQRAYNLYFSAATQSKTRTTRIEQYTQRILNGKGINDCTCGLSKRMPQCDGSHKVLGGR